MLIKGTDAIGKPVIAKSTGEKIDEVEDLIYDSHEHRVKALLVDKGGWFSGAKVIRIDDIASIGKDAIVVDTPEVIRKAEEVGGEVSSIAKENAEITQTEIISEDGVKLGKVSDILFDPDTGEVQSLEVSQGLNNMTSGKKHVLTSDIITVGKDATIVRKFTEDFLNQQARTQGIAGAANRVKNNLPPKEEVQQKASDVTEKAKVKAQEIKAAAKDKIAEAKEMIQEKARANALGKYLTINILGTDDSMIAMRGELITNELLKRAEQAGQLSNVITHTSAEPVE
jgi:uncharacterized protein YrrD